MSEEKDKSEFRVVDKRRFTNEGESKGDEPATSGTEKESVAAREPHRTESRPSDGAAASARRGAEPLDFSSLIVSLATQALMLMGEVPNADSVNVNMDAAKQTIDVIALLEVKTQGNLNEEESKLIGEVLTSLRMAYVRKIGK